MRYRTLGDIRASLGISLREMARRLNIPHQTLSRIETGENKSFRRSTELLRRMEEHYGVSAEHIGYYIDGKG